MTMFSDRFVTIEEKLHGVLVRHAINALRVTVGAIFLAFGVLKFFPGVSPAEALSIKTIDLLTLGLIPWEVGIAAIATLECFIGICLLANRWMRLAVWLLVIQFIGILAPLVLLTGRLFSGPHNAPTLEGQCVLKDIILVAAGMAIAAGTFRGGRLIRDEPGAPDAPPAPPEKPCDEPDASHKLQIVLSAAAGERFVQDVCDEHDITQMALPRIASREDWLAARRVLLDAEKALTREGDAIATQRRMLPMVEVSEPYAFTGPDGSATLLDLFEERHQLVVYHFMFHPDSEDGCPSCTAGRDDELGPGVLGHLYKRDTTYAMVSRAPFEKLERWRRLRGWDIPWYSTDDGPFSYDFGATIDESHGATTFNFREWDGDRSGQPFDMPGRSCFVRDGDRVFHTYSHFARATEATQTPYTPLDLTAMGRQEDWEKPAGRAYDPRPPSRHSSAEAPPQPHQRPANALAGRSRPRAVSGFDVCLSQRHRSGGRSDRIGRVGRWAGAGRSSFAAAACQGHRCAARVARPCRAALDSPSSLR